MTPTIYSLRIVFKKAMNTLLHNKQDKPDPSRRINPYVTEIPMGKIDPELRQNPYGRPGDGRTGPIIAAPGLDIPGITTNRKIEPELPPVEKKPSFVNRIVYFAIGDIINVFERIYHTTDTYKRRKREKILQKSKLEEEQSKREQFECLARGER